MNQIAYYRKYRPNDFKNLVGQEHIKTTILNSFREKQVAHAYLFCGPRGTGKTSTARLIAKGLNCLNPSNSHEPCNECEICQAINDNRLMDIIEIDAASNRGIDEMRDLREKIKFTPSKAEKKVFIIDEVHMLTKEAFNALLKTLEEPPPHAHFILATTERHKVPATIISRCQTFDFKRIADDTIISRLEKIAIDEKIKVEKEALVLIAKASEGGMRDAIGLLEQMSIGKKLTKKRVQLNLGLVDHQIINDFIELIISNQTEQALNYIHKIYTDGIDLNQLAKELKENLRIKMLEAVKQKDNTLAIKYSTLINHLNKLSEDLKRTSIPQLPYELMLIELGLTSLTNTNTPIVSTSNLISTPPQQSPKKSKIIQPISIPKKPLEKNTNTVIQTNDNQEFDLSSFRNQWGEVLTNLPRPILRLALTKAKLESFNKNTLEISIGSKFELEKLDNQKSRNELVETITKIIGATINLNFTLKNKPTKSIVPDNHKPPITSSPAKPPVEIKTNNPVEQVVNFFDGQITS